MDREILHRNFVFRDVRAMATRSLPTNTASVNTGGSWSPQANKKQRRQDHIPPAAQPARFDAVTHDAADVDAVGGGNEPVLLMQGLKTTSSLKPSSRYTAAA
jgi:hypothetical protein